MARLLTRDIRVLRAYLGGSTLRAIALDEEISIERARQLAARAFRWLRESHDCIQNEQVRTAIQNIHCAKTAQWRDVLQGYQEVVDAAIATLQEASRDALSGRAHNCLCNMGMRPHHITKESVRALLQSEAFTISKNMGHSTYNELVSWAGLTDNAAFQEVRQKHWVKKFQMDDAAKKERKKEQKKEASYFKVRMLSMEEIRRSYKQMFGERVR